MVSLVCSAAVASTIENIVEGVPAVRPLVASITASAVMARLAAVHIALSIITRLAGKIATRELRLARIATGAAWSTVTLTVRPVWLVLAPI